MCVAVSLMPGSTLTEEEIWKMGTTNGDGFGVAWVEDDLVHWYKTLKYAPKAVAEALLEREGVARLVHFRLATVGGTRADLCHPFEISPRANPRTKGAGKKVMIHNGHYGRWSELYDLMKKEDLLPDTGPWSDTRLIAYLASNDLDWLQILGGKVATLDHEGQLTHLGSWDDLREGVKVSNKGWNHDRVIHQGGYSGYRQWPGWNRNEAEWKKYEETQKELADERRQALEEARNSSGGTRSGGTRHVGSGDKDDPKGGRGKELPTTNSRPSANGEGAAISTDNGGGGGPSGGKVHKYDPKPWRNTANGKVYQVSPNGNVVEVTSSLTAEEYAELDEFDHIYRGM